MEPDKNLFEFAIKSSYRFEVRIDTAEDAYADRWLQDNWPDYMVYYKDGTWCYCFEDSKIAMLFKLSCG